MATPGTSLGLAYSNRKSHLVILFMSWGKMPGCMDDAIVRVIETQITKTLETDNSWLVNSEDFTQGRIEQRQTARRFALAADIGLCSTATVEVIRVTQVM